MVWILFLSTNRNYLQRNQLSAPNFGPETLTCYFYLFQIESSGTFLTRHFSTMLYHIVSDTEKFGSVPMVWIFFLSMNRNYLQRNQLSAFIFGPQLRRYSFYLFQIESSGTFLTSHFSTMLYHIV